MTKVNNKITLQKTKDWNAAKEIYIIFAVDVCVYFNQLKKRLALRRQISLYISQS